MNQEELQYYEEEWFNFAWDSELETVEDIRALAEIDIHNPRNFSIFCSYWDDNVLNSFITLFQYFEERQIYWKTLSVTGDDYSDIFRFVRSILGEANRLSLFEEIMFWVCGDEVSNSFFLNDLSRNNRLSTLNILECGKLLPEDYREICNLLIQSKVLRELRFQVTYFFNVDQFCEALVQNSSLEVLHLEFQANYLKDAVFSKIITTLASHPTLDELQIYTTHCGNLTSLAIQKLLSSSSSTLRTLCLGCKNDKDSRCSFDVHHIIQGLKDSNCSLERLEIFEAFDDDRILSKLFGELHHCSSLKVINLLSNSDVSLQDLEQLIEMDRLARPIKIDLPYTFHYEDASSAVTKPLEDLVSYHPEICIIGYKTIDGMSENFYHTCALNWHGRYLMDQPTTRVPLALWPLVLEMANSKPSMINFLLKGPVTFPI